MLEVAPTGDWPYELPPILLVSGGRGNDPEHVEVHLAVRRGNRHEALGWYRLRDIMIAAQNAGAVSAPHPEARPLRLTEPAEDVAA